MSTFHGPILRPPTVQMQHIISDTYVFLCNTDKLTLLSYTYLHLCLYACTNSRDIDNLHDIYYRCYAHCFLVFHFNWNMNIHIHSSIYLIRPKSRRKGWRLQTTRVGSDRAKSTRHLRPSRPDPIPLTWTKVGRDRLTDWCGHSYPFLGYYWNCG
jgi:hypothetical protein